MNPTHARNDSGHSNDANAPKNLGNTSEGLMTNNGLAKRATARLASIKLAGSKLGIRPNARFLAAFIAIALVATVLSVTAYMQEGQKSASALQQERASRLEKKPGVDESKAPSDTMVPSAVLANTASTANYTFATNSTSSLLRTAGSGSDNIDMTTGITSLLIASTDDTASSLITIPFDFYLMGVRYNQFSVNDNGNIRLGGTVHSGSPYSMPNGAIPILNPLGTDQRVGTDGIVTYKIIGSAPNRVLVIQWLNNTIPYPGAAVAGTGTYQTRLYETTGVVEYVYGTMGTGAGALTTYTVGFSVNTTVNNIISVNTTAHTASTSATVTTNAYSSNSTLPGLHSTANGSRRAYSFTPSATATSPTSLTFSGITTTGMTLNWTDAANEVGYAIYRSTDGGTTYTFQGSTATDVTTLAVTALQPGQTYFWQVYSVAEGTLSSSPLSGSQATTALGTTYFWVGASGADFNTAASWNTAADGTGTTRTTPTTSDVLIVDGAGTVPGGAMTISVSAAASIGALQITNSTTVTIQSSAAAQRILTLTGAAGDDFSIGASSSILLTSITNSVSIVFATSTGMTGTIAGTLTVAGASATATSATANSFLTTGGTGTVVTVSSGGVINNTATTNITTNGNVTGSAATLIFANGSAYNVSGATTGAPSIPLATWGATSTLTVTGLTSSSTAAANNAQTFGNLTYNCSAATGSFNFFGSTTSGIVQGTLTVQATNTGRLRGVSTGSLGINNVVVSGGTFEAVNSTGLVTITGSVTQTGGTFDVTAGTSAGTVKLAGNYTQSGAGVLLVSGSSSLNPIFEFNGASAQNLTLVNPVTGTLNVRVNNAAGINLTGALLLNGLTVSNGNITGSGTISYNATTSRLTYNSTNAAQVANALEFPAASGPVGLTINNTNTSPSNTVTIALNRTLPSTGVLTLTSGILVNTGNLLTISNTAIGGISGGSSTVYVRGAIARTLPASLTGTLTYTFPIGKGTYNPFELVNPTTTAGGSVVVQAEAFDANSGGSPGTNMSSINTDRYWAASITSGSGNFTSTFFKITDASASSTSAIASSATQAGSYDLVGGTSPTIVPGVSVTTTAPAATTIPGFFVLGTKAVPMAYVSSTTTQTVTTPIFTNIANQLIIGIQIVTAGNASPLSATSFSLNTTGTTAPGTDITNAKLWYTGLSSTFATTAQFGSTVPSPSGPYSITGSQTLSEGTNYFWLTYDIPSGATVNNFVDAECTSLTVGSAFTPTVTAPVGNRQIKAQLNGTYTIGASQVSPNYTKLTDAIADLNAFGVSGAVTFQLAADYTSATETFPLTINAINGGSASNTLTIKPASGVTATISGSNTSAIVKLNGADFVTIDGSNSGSTSRDLSITNTNTGTSSGVVWFASATASDGATNDTIKNCIVRGNASTTTLVAVNTGGTSALGTLALAPNSNTTIQNNLIAKAQIGILAAGVSAASLDLNLSVQGNTIGTSTAGDGFSFAGVYLRFQDTATANGNDIQNITSTGSTNLTPLAVVDCKSTTSSANKVHFANYSGGSTTKVYGIYSTSATFNSSGTPSNNAFINNTVYDLVSNGASSLWNTSGINNEGGYGDKYYFNSVSLTGQMGAATGPSAAISIGNGLTSAVATSGGFDFRDNIFSMTGSSTAASTHYSHYTTLANYIGSTLNYNDLYVAATGSATSKVGRINGVDQTDIAAWRTASGEGVNSISVNPQFNSATNLQPQLGSPVLDTGVSLSGTVTPYVDITGATRVDPPSMGAYEVGVDVAGPTITYTAFVNTTSTTNRTLSATITDASGVAGAGDAPRIYYRKNGGTYFSNQCGAPTGSVYPCTIDYSLVGGVVTNDVIDYYVVAQDTPGNVSANPSAGFSATNVNSITTPPTTPNTYSILAAITGTKTVCASLCDFNSLTNAGGIFQAINSSVVTGNLTIDITGDLTAELGTVSLNQTAEEPTGSNFTIGFQPSGPRVVSGSNTTTLININGADRVTFNGINAGGHSLLIRNTSATTGSVIRYIADASNDNLLNTTIESNTTSTSVFVSTGTSTGNDNIVISGNVIRDRSDAVGAPFNGIASSGTSVAISNSNLAIVGNSITNFTQAGIITFAGTDGLSITGNDISETASRTTTLSGISIQASTGTNLISTNKVHGLRTSQTASSVSATGIFFLDARSTTVSLNQIYDFPGLAPGTGRITGIESDGSSGTPASLNIVNNMISLAPAVNQQVMGIFDFGFGGNTFTADFNSVYLGGTATSASSWALVRGGGTPTTFAARDNLLFNNRTGGTGSHFAIGDQSGATGTWVSDNNFFAGTGATAANFFDYNGTAVPFATWKAGPPARDAASIANTAATYTVATFFADVTTGDLHLRRSAPAVLNPAENLGAPVAGVISDFDNDARDGSTPDIGADEVMSVSFSASTFRPAADHNEGTTVTITVNRTSGAGAPATATFSFGGSATGGAACTTGVDYISPASTLDFAAAESTKTFVIETCTDGLFEGAVPETVTMTLVSVTGDGIVGIPDTASTNITDIDTAPTFAIGDVTQVETDSLTTNFVFTVTKTGSTALDSVITYSTNDGTATSPSDFTAVTGGTITILAAAPSGPITISVNGDTTYEANETFTVDGTNVTNGTFTDASGLGTITNDDTTPPVTVAVNTTADHDDGFCTPLAPGNDCTLREAINAANFNLVDANTINFNIPLADLGFAGGVWTIRPTSALPVIRNLTTIDGDSQAVFTSNTNPAGPEVVVNGALAGAASGFFISGDGNTIKGLVVNGFTEAGIAISYTSDATPSNNQILNNYVGTNTSGTAAVANDLGVDIHGFASPGSQASNNTVTGNVISGNTGIGVGLCDSNLSTIFANFIGTGPSGVGSVGNGNHGIIFQCAGVNDNAIQANTIANNGGAGIYDQPDYSFGNNGHARNKFEQNSIFSNASLGINLIPPGGVDGVTGNDPMDPDTGANTLQNFPQIFTATVTGSTNTISGVLNTTPATTGYVLEFFSNVSCDGVNGEGKTYLGPVTTGLTDGAGNVAFVFHPLVLNVGDVVTATATDTAGNTSEFSQCKTVATGSPGNIQFTSATYTVGEGGGTAAITVTRAGGSDGAITANFSTSDGTATDSNNDYEPVTSFPINYIDGQTGSQTVNVTINEDAIYEGNETVNLALSGTVLLRPQGVNTPLGGLQAAVLTITENDTVPTFSVDDVTHLEGNGGPGSTAYLFTITKTGATALSSNVDYETVDGTAVSTGGTPDFTAIATTNVVFLPLETTKQFTVLVNGDTTVEPDQAFSVLLTDASGATIADANGTGTITNDDSVAAADLAIAKIDSQDPVTQGNNFTYTITVTNNGPDSATNVVMDDPLPAGVTFVSATPSQGTCSGTSTVNCTLGTIANGANATVTITVTATLTGLQSNTATATATESDPTTPNTATETTQVNAAAPTLGTYPNTSIALSANATVTPSAPPTGTTKINVSTSTNFKGTLSADPVTGNVFVDNAHPVAPIPPGFYTVTVTAFNGAGASTTTTFQLTVTTPATCNPAGFAPAANYGVGDSPFHVAVGDFNGDDKQDLAVANTGTPNNVSILLGLGGGIFGPATNFVGDNRPASIGVGDFNGDGKQDLAVANLISSNVSILSGNGLGSFSAPVNFVAGTNPVSLAVGDFNGDGRLDIVTANFTSNNVSILLGDGAGSFSAPTNFAAGTNPFSVAVGDFNGDLKQDLAIANDGSNNVSVLLGFGGGTFGPATNFVVGTIPVSVVVGDFNGDGKQDLATANDTSNDVSILLGNGLGSFSAASTFVTGTKPNSVALGDFNGDGKQDLATANVTSDNLSILLGDGAGSFSAPTSFGAGTDPVTVAVGDFNGDGKQDLAVGNQGSDDVSILLRQCPTAAQSTVSGQVVDGAGLPVEGVAVRMTGTQNRLTITDKEGKYIFEEVETGGFYTVTPSRANYLFSPGQRSFSQIGQNTDAVFTASAMGSSLNPLDSTEYFVRQQYLDFLGREPDEAGFNFWVNNIAACGGDANCVAAKRTDTSAAFFLSIEFQQTGYLVYRMYQSAYGDRPGTPVPLTRAEFNPDTAAISDGVVVNQSGWEAKLEANKQAFASAFVARSRFTAAYPVTFTPAEFVDRLFQNAGVTPNPNDSAAAINEFGGASDTADAASRARAVRRVAENESLREQEFNQAFVLMQYFGYLGRDPNAAPDGDFSGYNFWLNKLDSFNGDFRRAEMVKAFLVAGEYRGRFPR